MQPTTSTVTSYNFPIACTGVSVITGLASVALLGSAIAIALASIAGMFLLAAIGTALYIKFYLNKKVERQHIEDPTQQINIGSRNTAPTPSNSSVLGNIEDPQQLNIVSGNTATTPSSSPVLGNTTPTSNQFSITRSLPIDLSISTLIRPVVPTPPPAPPAPPRMPAPTYNAPAAPTPAVPPPVASSTVTAPAKVAQETRVPYQHPLWIKTVNGATLTIEYYEDTKCKEIFRLCNDVLLKRYNYIKEQNPEVVQPPFEAVTVLNGRLVFCGSLIKNESILKDYRFENEGSPFLIIRGNIAQEFLDLMRFIGLEEGSESLAKAKATVDRCLRDKLPETSISEAYIIREKLEFVITNIADNIAATKKDPAKMMEKVKNNLNFAKKDQPEITFEMPENWKKLIEELERIHGIADALLVILKDEMAFLEEQHKQYPKLSKLLESTPLPSALHAPIFEYFREMQQPLEKFLITEIDLKPPEAIVYPTYEADEESRAEMRPFKLLMPNNEVVTVQANPTAWCSDLLKGINKQRQLANKDPVAVQQVKIIYNNKIVIFNQSIESYSFDESVPLQVILGKTFTEEELNICCYLGMNDPNSYCKEANTAIEEFLRTNSIPINKHQALRLRYQLVQSLTKLQEYESKNSKKMKESLEAAKENYKTEIADKELDLSEAHVREILANMIRSTNKLITFLTLQFGLPVSKAQPKTT